MALTVLLSVIYMHLVLLSIIYLHVFAVECYVEMDFRH